MICKKCNAWNEDENKFCMRCGEKLLEDTQNQPVVQEQQRNTSGGGGLRAVAVVLLVLGAVGIFFGTVMFGDIGVVSTLAGIMAIFNGIGFIIANKRLGDGK